MLDTSSIPMLRRALHASLPPPLWGELMDLYVCALLLSVCLRALINHSFEPYTTNLKGSRFPNFPNCHWHQENSRNKWHFEKTKATFMKVFLGDTVKNDMFRSSDTYPISKGQTGCKTWLWNTHTQGLMSLSAKARSFLQHKISNCTSLLWRPRCWQM